MFILRSNSNLKTADFNITNNKNLTYITKLRLLLKIIQYINLYQNLDDIYNNNSITIFDIKFNLKIFNYSENYKLKLILIVELILEILYNGVYRYRYMEFNKLD